MILVTGSSGHIGNVLVRELCKMGESVLILTKTGDKPNWLKDLDIEVMRGDLKDRSSIQKAVAQAEVVFHLAGKISISSFDDDELTEINVIGTQYIVDACVEFKIKKLIYTSSVHVLSDGNLGNEIKEDTNYNIEKMYGAYTRSKARATTYVLEAAHKGLPVVVCYPSGVMGPYDYRGSEAGKLIKDYATNKLPVYIDGGYNFVDVRDVVQGLIQAWKRGRNNEDYILAGNQMTLDEFFTILADLEPKMKKPRIKIPLNLALSAAWILERICKLLSIKPLFTVYGIKVLQSNCNFSSNKARDELGYQFRSMDECIRDSLLWLKENNRV